MSTISTGKKGEDFAVRYLLDLGHEIIERNFRNKTGEIDIISLKENLIFFIEVKTWSENFIHPLESFSSSKVNKMKSLAKFFFHKKNWKESEFLVTFCLIFNGKKGTEFYKDLF